jgi:DNA mismatch repair protein MutS
MALAGACSPLASERPSLLAHILDHGTTARRAGSILGGRGSAMTFQSILDVLSNDGATSASAEAPNYFRDLNLDQIVASITAGRNEYQLTPFFYRPLKTREAIVYRQAVMRDLENRGLFACVAAFTEKMKSVREHIAQSKKLSYKYQKEAWLLDALEIYCAAVASLLAEAKLARPSSPGFVGLLGYLADYVDSSSFRELSGDVTSLKAQLASIRYDLLVDLGAVTVTRYNEEPDYGAEIQADFEKFKQGDVGDHMFKFSDFVGMNHIEAGVLERVARLFPDIFAALDAFAAQYSQALDPTVCRFDREVQFYMSYIEHVRQFEKNGLCFCTPFVSNEDKKISACNTFDIGLAKVLADRNLSVVTNDFHLDGGERIFIVSGPNQGGKTTFARTFGQLHYLGCLGFPVPGSSARLFLFDQLFTQFEREEDIHNLRGKLHDDLFRFHRTFNRATSNSIIIMNEVFNSTSLKDAIFLSTKMIEKIIALDMICVCVTFIDELATLSDTIVTMASNVNPENFAERTYKIIRRPPDGLAYAISIAEKYRLTYPQLLERLPS